jgi:hypothetical protein
MNKKTRKQKMPLATETVRKLEQQQLGEVKGAAICASCGNSCQSDTRQ